MDLYDKPLNDGLYKWNRHDTKLKARMKDSSSVQTIHKWLRKVENASEAAINAVCNDNEITSPYSNGSSNINKKNVKNNSDAYSEAHDLLNQWITEKIRFDMDDDIYNYVDAKEMNHFNEKTTESTFKLSDYLNDDSTNNNITTGMLHISGLDYDKYDEAYIAKDIVNEMMKKKYVNAKDFLKYDNKPKKSEDLKAKIEIRHQMVKDKREKRVKDLEEKRKEALLKKEAEFNAREMIKKEEYDKRMRLQMEQQLLDQETERLRKQIAEKRRQEELVKQKQREYEVAKLEKEKEENVKHQKLFDYYTAEYAVDLKRKEMEEKRSEELLDAYLKAKNMRNVQKAFSTWYGLVLELRLKTGRAKALHDWKIAQKLFNSWKRHCLNKKIQKEQELHENLIKIQNMKNTQACHYYKMKLLSRCFATWKVFNRNEQLNKQLEVEKKKTKNRMEMFLEAVNSGKLNSAQQESASTEKTDTQSEIPVEKVQKSRIRSASSANRKNRDTDSISRGETPNSSKKQPIDDLMLVIPDTEREERINKQIREIIRPWLKNNTTVSNGNHRLKAHEKLFQEQSKMIKEQKKLIDDLKYQQNQQVFKEQIVLLEQIKQKQDELEKMQKLQYEKEKALLREEAKLKSFKPKNKQVVVQKEHEIKRFEVSKIEDDSAASSARPSSTQPSSNRPQNIFLKNMEERAQKREQMRKEREEKRQKEYMEKFKEIEQKEAEKRQVDEEERRKQNAEFYEKRKLEKELKLKREAEREHERQGEEKADRYYRKYLLRHYCMNGLKKLILIRNLRMDLAVQAHEIRIVKNTFKTFRNITKSIMDVKKHLADRFYKKYLLKYYLTSGWKMLKVSLHLEMQKAQRFYIFHLKCKLFRNWFSYTKLEIDKFNDYDQWIDTYATNRVKLKYIKIWKSYPSYMKAQREREKRLNNLRNKVQQLIPDFHKASIESTKNTEH